MSTPNASPPISRRQLFEDWLEMTDPRVQRFRDFLTPVQLEMDYSRQSFVQLERLLLETYESGSNPFAREDDLDFLDGALRYVGQTLIRHFGGHWDLDESGSVHDGLPIVVLDFAVKSAISPRDLIMWTVARNEPVLSQVFDGQVERATWDYGEGAAGEAAAGSGTALQGALQPSVWAAQVKDVAASWSEKFADFEADYSRDSLAGLSAVVRSTLHSTQEFDAESTHEFALGAVAYLGEAMRRAGGGAWVHGDGERDPEFDPFAGVPFLSRDEGAHLIAGAPYWGIYDFVDGDADSIRKAYDDYCSRG